MKILVPGNVPFPVIPTLDDPADVVAPYTMSDPIPQEHWDAQALVTWTSPARVMSDAATQLTDLRWVQTLNAGPDAALAAGFAPRIVITSGRGLHDRTVTEHTLALVLASVRRFDRTMAAQREQRWDRDLAKLQSADETGFTLNGARITIWGFGSIAHRLTPHLTALGAEVVGVARSAGLRGDVEVVSESSLPDILPATDILISLLPAMPQTRHALNAATLALLPAHARFVNVGRGATVDEEALVAALRDGRLAGAALDVTETEPLPPTSPLWHAPNIIITPHVAGTRPQEVPAFLTAQIRAWKASGAAGLRNVVAR